MGVFLSLAERDLHHGGILIAVSSIRLIVLLPLESTMDEKLGSLRALLRMAGNELARIDDQIGPILWLNFVLCERAV